MWDDGQYEIFTIIYRLSDPESLEIPIKCPVCETKNAHIYMHRWEKGKKGTIWTWCSSCKACDHGRIDLPEWWENSSFIDSSKLTSHPNYLEEHVEFVDEYVKRMLQNQI